MKLFWLMLVITTVALVYSGSFLLVMALMVFDFIVLWSSFEMRKGKGNGSALIQKLEKIEELTSKMFEKISGRQSHEEKDKKEVIEWLDKF
jgi:hypothetical protein